VSLKSPRIEASTSASRSLGRPGATTHADIEQAAFTLFHQHGFEGTTMDAIADAVGVGTRTLFRYYPSKNDIPWGQFQRTIDVFRSQLEASSPGIPVELAIRAAILEFNRFPQSTESSHRERMRLILTTPELQAHSVHQYAAWRQVIAQFVAARTGLPETGLLPRLAGRVSLAAALSAYETWLDDERSDLLLILEQALDALRAGTLASGGELAVKNRGHRDASTQRVRRD